MVARVYMMYPILVIQAAGSGYVPMGKILLCAAVGFLPLWEYYQNI